ncbi:MULTISPECIES: hypothetical protein [Pantoea]|jgi:hypothetical protein|uniref:Uncharacterized protein n=1 Tax=Pantoea brenneri TaxID=472694 RepID=A0A7Y6NH52_9GAMM|nr:MULTISPECIES: hypothetical protein [Pantoea]MBZ6397011.1 hypothetical protein [Pantoea sp.]MBZ6440238.1 hypothetical protein [Pantoea sp.]NUY43400.1 hypothetical protein [Pantoea brenneri]NUY51034.1 hypothetical protein [Pantoea brenneri]NUY61235.1 hypothetical protein [Pantoea brenneri]
MKLKPLLVEFTYSELLISGNPVCNVPALDCTGIECINCPLSGGAVSSRVPHIMDKLNETLDPAVSHQRHNRSAK